ncbi:MAG: MBL fold metallo-hydrolase [Pseudomonadota bacterium]
MDITILGSGGCMIIPKPLCKCRVCSEARVKGGPYRRTGPSVFIHDENILIDTPAEIAYQLNRSGIEQINYLLFTHLDPDHVEGFRVVEQITLDFRTWRAYDGKDVKLVLPEELFGRLGNIQSCYGSIIDFYRSSGFVHCISYSKSIKLGAVRVTAIPVDRGNQIAFIYVIQKNSKKIIYAPCDIKPFPENRKEVLDADLLIIQPGIFENGLKHDFKYPDDHISRTTLYTFDETLKLAKRINSKTVLLTHIEEYWNRSYDDYKELEKQFDNIKFAYDGLRINI